MIRLTERFRAALATLAVAIVLPAGPAAAASSCFHLRDWNGWSASQDGKAMFVRTGVNRFFRLDFGQACIAATRPGAHVVTHVRGGSSMICAPVDLDLRVSVAHGVATPCIVSAITPLSAEEAKTLPRWQRP
jgi:hypothetical protein